MDNSSYFRFDDDNKTKYMYYVKRLSVLYCSGVRMKIPFPYRDYSAEAFYNDVSECSGVGTLRKPREIQHFSLGVSICLDGYFHKRCIPAPGVTSLYCKHALSLCFIKSYPMICIVSSIGFILCRSRITVGFIITGFHGFISRPHSQINRHGLYALFLTSTNLRIQRILPTTQIVLSWSSRFGGGHIGWSQLQFTALV